MVRKTEIEIENVTKRFGGHTVISDLSANMRAGDFTVILGPSGCGKSTLLNLIAGLDKISEGKIKFGGKEVQNIPAKDRGCAMVFQNYALYPHMSVADNIGYALKVAKIPKPERNIRISQVAKIAGLKDLLERRPSQLSGGQRQRVAIARAIVRESGILLFDEPLSNLDAQLRNDMRLELTELHNRVGATSVFVTHDQVEAMSMADKILILKEGKVEQYGTPDEIYENPASVFVAGFIGTPPMNLIDAKGDGNTVRLRDGTAVAPAGIVGPVVLGIRPEDIFLDENGPIEFSVRYQERLGPYAVITGELFDGSIMRINMERDALGLGDTRLRLSISRGRFHLFDCKSGRLFPNGMKRSSR